MSEYLTGAVTVEFPESVRKSGIDTQYVKEAVAAISYYNGTLSEKESCTLINVSRRTFEETVLPKFGLSIVGGTLNDALIEVEGL